MTEKKYVRVGCDNCSCVAKANLDGRNLCTGCLLSALLSSSESDLFERVRQIPPVSTLPNDTQSKETPSVL